MAHVRSSRRSEEVDRVVKQILKHDLRTPDLLLSSSSAERSGQPHMVQPVRANDVSMLIDGTELGSVQAGGSSEPTRRG